VINLANPANLLLLVGLSCVDAMCPQTIPIAQSSSTTTGQPGVGVRFKTDPTSRTDHIGHDSGTPGPISDVHDALCFDQDLVRVNPGSPPHASPTTRDSPSTNLVDSRSVLSPALDFPATIPVDSCLAITAPAAPVTDSITIASGSSPPAP
jgi:hypothetical protein